MMSEKIEFKKSFLGVNKKTVLEYLGDVSKDIDNKLLQKDTEITNLKNTVNELELKIADRERKLKTYEDAKKQISNAIIKAEETARMTIMEAQNKASALLADAEKKINETMTYIEDEKNKKTREIESELSSQKELLGDYKKEVTLFKNKIKEILIKFSDDIEKAAD